MTTRPTGSRARHLIERQGHRCFLVITEQCKTRDGALSMPRARKALKRLPKSERRAIQRAQQADGSTATVEHIWPQARKAERPANVPSCLVVIACRACNNAKGGRLPTDAELARALYVNAAWYGRQVNQSLRVADAPGA